MIATKQLIYKGELSMAQKLDDLRYRLPYYGHSKAQEVCCTPKRKYDMAIKL